MNYLRFVIPTRDEDSGRRQGLFQALAGLHDLGVLLAHEEHEWVNAYEWFRKNLEEPDRFASFSRPHAKRVALSWFKDSASEHIRQMRRLSEILRDHGVEVTLVRTERVGYVVYEDEHQIVAEPFKETNT